MYVDLEARNVFSYTFVLMILTLLVGNMAYLLQQLHWRARLYVKHIKARFNRAKEIKRGKPTAKVIPKANK